MSTISAKLDADHKRKAGRRPRRLPHVNDSISPTPDEKNSPELP